MGQCNNIFIFGLVRFYSEPICSRSNCRDQLGGANLCENDFKKVIERYTSTYQEIRTSELGRQYLYTRPFIRTQYSGTISCNCFLNLFLYEHSILWIVRDYFYKKENRLFTSEFGRYFEEYFRELLMEYVPQTNYHKIPEENIPPR